MTTTPRPIPTTSWQAKFAALALIWGFSFLLIKVADEQLAPLQVAFGRMLFGSVTLVVLIALRRLSLPRDRVVWAHLALAGALSTAIPFSLFAYGEQRTSAVLAGIFNATTPIMTLLGATIVLRSERAGKSQVIGVICGFGGVLVVLGVWNGLSQRGVTGDILCILAALCYGFGTPYLRRFLAHRKEGPEALATGMLLCGTIELGIVTVVATHAPHLSSWRVPMSVVVLGGLGTGIAYVFMFAVIRDTNATVAASVTYVVPIVSTIAGITLLHEHFTWNVPLGGLVILLGVALSQGRLRPRRSPRAPSRLVVEELGETTIDS